MWQGLDRGFSSVLFNKKSDHISRLRVGRLFSNSTELFKTKYPSSIRRRDSNSQPSDYESPPFTTRPGLPPKYYEMLKC